LICVSSCGCCVVHMSNNTSFYKLSQQIFTSNNKQYFIDTCKYCKFLYL